MKSAHILKATVENTGFKSNGNDIYKFVVHLIDERRNVSVELTSGDLCTSPEEAAASIPAVLADRELYDRAVENAIKQINNVPNEALTIFAYHKGELRSPWNGAPYELGALYAYPIVENPPIGMEIYFGSRAAYAAALDAARFCETVAIASCRVGNVEMVEGAYLTDALIPLKLEYLVILSPIRVREDGVIEQWDSTSMDWRSTDKKYEASQHDVVELVESDRGKYRYILPTIYRCP